MFKNKLSKREIKDNNPIYNCIKNSKIPRVNLTNKVKYVYTENYKNVREEDEKTQIMERWKTERITIVKMAILSKAKYNFNWSRYQNSNGISHINKAKKS